MRAAIDFLILKHYPKKRCPGGRAPYAAGYWVDRCLCSSKCTHVCNFYAVYSCTAPQMPTTPGLRTMSRFGRKLSATTLLCPQSDWQVFGVWDSFPLPLPPILWQREKIKCEQPSTQKSAIKKNIFFSFKFCNVVRDLDQPLALRPHGGKVCPSLCSPPGPRADRADLAVEADVVLCQQVQPHHAGDPRGGAESGVHSH